MKEQTLRGETRNMEKKGVAVQKSRELSGKERPAENSRPFVKSTAPFRFTNAVSETFCSSALSLDQQGGILFTFKQQQFVRVTCSFIPDTVFELLRHWLVWQYNGKVQTAFLNLSLHRSVSLSKHHIHRPWGKVLFDLHYCYFTTFPISNINSYWLSRWAWAY